MTNDELFEELSQLLMAREAILENPDAHNFDEKCRSLFVGAMGLARELCGETVLKAAAGSLSESHDRADTLNLMASRIDMSSYAYASLPDDEAALSHAHDEIRYIAAGDKPVIFARLSSSKVKVRLYAAKFGALAWNAYLEGLGIPLVERQAEISKAFGYPWDTIARWDSAPRKAEGDQWVDRYLGNYRRRGERNVALWEMNEGEDWQSGLKRAGQEFRATNRESSDGR